jgi:hypothetical protein
MLLPLHSGLPPQHQGLQERESVWWANSDVRNKQAGRACSNSAHTGSNLSLQQTAATLNRVIQAMPKHVQRHMQADFPPDTPCPLVGTCAASCVHRGSHGLQHPYNASIQHGVCVGVSVLQAPATVAHGVWQQSADWSEKITLVGVSARLLDLTIVHEFLDLRKYRMPILSQICSRMEFRVTPAFARCAAKESPDVTAWPA